MGESEREDWFTETPVGTAEETAVSEKTEAEYRAGLAARSAARLQAAMDQQEERSIEGQTTARPRRGELSPAMLAFQAKYHNADIPDECRDGTPPLRPAQPTEEPKMDSGKAVKKTAALKASPAPQAPSDPLAAIRPGKKYKPTQEAINAAKSLWAAVEANRTAISDRRLPKVLSTAESTDSFEKLTRIGIPNAKEGVPVSEWQPVLRWHCANLAGKFQPHVFCGTSFREHYPRLLSAYTKVTGKTADTAKAPQIDENATETLDMLGQYEWPLKAQRALPGLVQQSWDHYWPIREAMDAMIAAKDQPGANAVVKLDAMLIGALDRENRLTPDRWWTWIAETKLYAAWNGHNVSTFVLSLVSDDLYTYWKPAFQAWCGNQRSLPEFLGRLQAKVDELSESKCDVVEPEEERRA